ncbi:MAG: hypothetical protein LUC22_02225 [Prevotella sp.]|nr:hypothetical protein [Prevotella sp.]
MKTEKKVTKASAATARTTPVKQPAKKWSEMTYEERRAALPKKLNKYGEWLLRDDNEKTFLVIKDMRAVMK